MSVRDLIFSVGTPALKSKKPVRVLGIDLGTTNSTVAEIVYEPSTKKDISVRCLAVEQPTGSRSHWHPLVPSVVALHEGGEIVGEGARQLRACSREAGLTEECNLFTEVKNYMGLARTYSMAPAGYRSPAEVSGRILSFLYEAARKDKAQESARTTVTVPASFQVAQREDTLKAAELARINVKGGDLLDEPVAAFIGYLADHPDQRLVEIGDTKHLMVFDFGGGTCDVALFRLSTDLAGGLEVASLAVSRYNRLGGGDIDRVILHTVLLPQLLEQNRLDRHAIDFETKKSVIEPAFIGVAETLKIGLCEKLALADDNVEETDHLREVCHKKFTCNLPEGGSLTLVNPSLNQEEFEEVLKPFLNTDLLFVRDTDYYQTLSIFSPIQDALERCGLNEEQIDLCLLAGGSCLIPQVRQALSAALPLADLLTFATADATQTAVAKGAALNALSLALQDRPVVRSVCQESIAIVTSSGTLDLVKRGAPLPWPPEGGYHKNTNLTLPETTSRDPLSVRVEVVAREEGGHRILMSELWDIPAPVKAGDRIRLEYRYDENQVLEIRAYHAERNDVTPLNKSKQHPLTHVANPQVVRLRIEKTEEQLRTGTVLPRERRNMILNLAEDCAELRHYEKAIGSLAGLLRQRNEPDAFIINRMALYCGYMGDSTREERLYGEASAADPTLSAPWFNLALLYKKQQRLEEARHAVEMAVGLEERSAPYYVLQAQIARAFGNEVVMKEILERAMGHFTTLVEQDEWELGWFITAVEMRGDRNAATLAREERSRRKVKSGAVRFEVHGVLPAMAV